MFQNANQTKFTHLKSHANTVAKGDLICRGYILFKKLDEAIL